MGGKTRHPGGRAGSSRAGNVIHLRPRQWLETVEDLVPIGAPATGSSDESPGAGSPKTGRPAAPDSRRPGRARPAFGQQPVLVRPEPEPIAAEPIIDAPAAAAAFWGEDAANVQDALQAPMVAAPSDPDEPAQHVAATSPGSDSQRPRASKPRGSVLAMAIPEVQSLLSRVQAMLSQLASVQLPRRAAMAMLATGLVVLAAVVISSSLIGVTIAHPARVASSPNNAKLTDIGNEAAKVAAMLTPANIPPLALPHVHARRTKRHALVAHPTVTHVTAVSSSGGGTPTSSSSTGGQPVSAPYTGSAGGSPTATSASSPASSKPAGPTGPVSLLGAGTSPSG